LLLSLTHNTVLTGKAGSDDPDNWHADALLFVPSHRAVDDHHMLTFQKRVLAVGWITAPTASLLLAYTTATLGKARLENMVAI
jgi:hypothetical protein